MDGDQDAICHLCGSTVKEKSMYAHVRLCKKGKGRGRRLYPEPPLHPKLKELFKNDTGKYPCPHEGCDHLNPMKSRLIKHFNVAHNRQNCRFCGKEYGFYQLEEHIAFQHTGKTDRVQCPDCPQKFFNRTYLRRHVEAVHVAEKNWICSVCGEGFTTRRDEVQHRHEKHNRNRKWPCPVCGKIFRSSTLIQPHVDVAHPGIVVPAEMIKKAE